MDGLAVAEDAPFAGQERASQFAKMVRVAAELLQQFGADNEVGAEHSPWTERERLRSVIEQPERRGEPSVRVNGGA